MPPRDRTCLVQMLKASELTSIHFEVVRPPRAPSLPLISRESADPAGSSASHATPTAGRIQETDVAYCVMKTPKRRAVCEMKVDPSESPL
jgi:hypothetical protein